MCALQKKKKLAVCTNSKMDELEGYWVEPVPDFAVVGSLFDTKVRLWPGVVFFVIFYCSAMPFYGSP